MLERLDAEHWEGHAEPEGNPPGEVLAALRALADPADPDRSRAYHRMLYALGNDHAGTYYPVAVPAIAFLGEILREASLVARLRVLDVLLELDGSFVPALGHDEVDTARGRRSLKAVVHEAVIALRADVEARCRTPESEEEERLARDLLESIDD